MLLILHTLEDIFGYILIKYWKKHHYLLNENYRVHKNEFTTANYLNRLIYINVIIFLIINIFSVGASLFLIETNDLIEKLMLPSEITELIKQP